MSFFFINPEELGPASGYSNGVLTEAGGRLLFVAGQIAWNEKHEILSDNLVEQFDLALANVIAVVRSGGGQPEQIARMVIYVTDKNKYRASLEAIGACYRMRMGKHFPAMVLVEVKSLFEDRAQVEIEAVAVVS